MLRQDNLDRRKSKNVRRSARRKKQYLASIAIQQFRYSRLCQTGGARLAGNGVPESEKISDRCQPETFVLGHRQYDRDVRAFSANRDRPPLSLIEDLKQPVPGFVFVDGFHGVAHRLF